MKKMLGLFIILGFFAMAQTAFTNDVPVGKAVIELFGGKKGNVTFPHQTHQKVLVDCMVCHSIFPQKQGVIQEMVSQGTLKQKDVMTHCQTCHRAKNREGVKSGPTICNDCHQKK